MLRFVAARLASLVATLAGVTLAVGLLVEIVPGDPVDALVGQAAPEEVRARVRADLDLDRPWIARWARFVRRAAQGDLGTSYVTGRDVAAEIAATLPRTARLAAAALLVAVATGLGMGCLAAAFHRRAPDIACLAVAVAGISAPVFATGLALRYLLADLAGLLPPAGYGGLAYLVLPALTLGSRSAAYLARLARATLLEVLSSDFVRTARAKGLGPLGVHGKHALAVAAPPLIAVFALDLASFLSGSVVTETVFDWPGLGRYALTAIQARDLPAIQGVVLVMAALFVAANAIADILRAAIDPRLR